LGRKVGQIRVGETVEFSVAWKFLGDFWMRQNCLLALKNTIAGEFRLALFSVVPKETTAERSYGMNDAARFGCIERAGFENEPTRGISASVQVGLETSHRLRT
jgi:hypothetical protein